MTLTSIQKAALKKLLYHTPILKLVEKGKLSESDLDALISIYSDIKVSHPPHTALTKR